MRVLRHTARWREEEDADSEPYEYTLDETAHGPQTRTIIDYRTERQAKAAWIVAGWSAACRGSWGHATLASGGLGTERRPTTGEWVATEWLPGRRGE
jgi:hypothetical protein